MLMRLTGKLGQTSELSGKKHKTTWFFRKPNLAFSFVGQLRLKPTAVRDLMFKDQCS